MGEDSCRNMPSTVDKKCISSGIPTMTVNGGSPDLCYPRPQYHQQRATSVSSGCSDADSESTTNTYCGGDSIHSIMEENEQDLQYGPGIVSKLRTKFLSITMKQDRGRGGLHSNMRRSCSLENILESVNLTKPFSEPANHFNYTQHNNSSNQKRFVQNRKEPAPAWATLKRAKSMDSLLCNLESAQVNNDVSETDSEKGGSTNGHVKDPPKLIMRKDGPLNRPVLTLCDEELPKPDTVKTYKRMFEPADSYKKFGSVNSNVRRRPPVLRASAKSVSSSSATVKSGGSSPQVAMTNGVSNKPNGVSTPTKSAEVTTITPPKPKVQCAKEITKRNNQIISNGQINHNTTKSQYKQCLNNTNRETKDIDMQVRNMNMKNITESQRINTKTDLPKNNIAINEESPSTPKKPKEVAFPKRNLRSPKFPEGFQKPAIPLHKPRLLPKKLASPTKTLLTNHHHHASPKIINLEKSPTLKIINLEKSPTLKIINLEKPPTPKIINLEKPPTPTKLAELKAEIKKRNDQIPSIKQNGVSNKLNDSDNKDSSVICNAVKSSSPTPNVVEKFTSNLARNAKNHHLLDEESRTLKSIQQELIKKTNTPKINNSITENIKDEIVTEMTNKPTSNNVGMTNPPDIIPRTPEVEKTSPICPTPQTNGEVSPIAKDGISSSPSPKKLGNGASPSNSMVFDFRGKEVRSHVALQPAPFGCRAAVSKKRVSMMIDGKESSPYMNGYATNGSNHDEDDEPDFYMDYSLPGPCGLIFEGENIRVGKGALLSTRNKDLKIHFDEDTEKNTFVYPSESSLLVNDESDLSSPLENNNTTHDSIGASTASTETNGVSSHNGTSNNSGVTLNLTPVSTKLKSVPIISTNGTNSSSLMSYTPSVLRTVDNIQPGLYRADKDKKKPEMNGNSTPAENGQENRNGSSLTNGDNGIHHDGDDEGIDGEMLKPADPEFISSWSLSANTSDLLF